MANKKKLEDYQDQRDENWFKFALHCMNQPREYLAATDTDISVDQQIAEQSEWDISGAEWRRARRVALNTLSF